MTIVYQDVHSSPYLSLFDANSTDFVGLENYRYIFTNDAVLTAIRNNGLWPVFFTLLTVTLGLLFDRVSYEAAAKALIFLPMALSFVAAGVIEAHVRFPAARSPADRHAECNCRRAGRRPGRMANQSLDF